MFGIFEKQIDANDSEIQCLVRIDVCAILLFMRVGQKAYIQGYTKEFENITAHGWTLFLIHFNVLF